MGYGHIYKMDSDPKYVKDVDKKPHRKVPYDDLSDALMGDRLCLEYANDSPELDKPYWINPRDGHLPDRVIAINHSIIDMLKMGDYPMAFYLKDTESADFRREMLEKKAKDLSISPNFSARQIALTFFIASHYIADAFKGHNATHIGFKMNCIGDYAVAEGFNPRIRFIGPETIMAGDDCCHFVFELDQSRLFKHAPLRMNADPFSSP